MRLENTQEAFDKFARYVVQQARTNLTKQKKNVSKGLYNSLGYNLSVYPNSMRLKFTGMDENSYGAYVDRGVSGTEKKYPTPFSYKDKRPPVSALLPWIQKKRLRFRDADGKFKKGSYQSMAYVISNNIYKRGIKPSYFFTKPFEKAFKGLPDEVVIAFGLDLDQFLDFSNNGK
jgi:hypothetical protein